MTVTVLDDGTVAAKVLDAFSDEEYVLHRTSVACGSFVGMVRAEHERVLLEIAEKCFDPDVFKSDYARMVVQYIRGTYGDELEFLWSRFPNNAIFRRKDTGKWYGAMLVLSKRKLAFDSDELVDVLDFRMNTDAVKSVVDGVRYFPGYHMNKKHWVTVCLDGSVPVDEIMNRIAESYKLAAE